MSSTTSKVAVVTGASKGIVAKGTWSDPNRLPHALETSERAQATNASDRAFCLVIRWLKNHFASSSSDLRAASVLERNSCVNLPTTLIKKSEVVIPDSFRFARAKEKLSALVIVFFGRPSDILYILNRLANGRR